MRAAVYNEIDPYAANWLRNLIRRGLIADGEVDERSISDVQPDDYQGFTQVHLFAGIGGWSLAARLAGWPDDRPLWTGSCPCQPFSAAGKQKGEADSRHLWPEFFRLIRDAIEPPAIVVGEQVASRPGRDWLAGVFTDLESVGYAVAGADLCAAGVGAPHIRQRLFWVADADPERCGEARRPAGGGHACGGGAPRGLADAAQQCSNRSGDAGSRGWGEPSNRGGLVNPVVTGLEGHAGDGNNRREPGRVGAYPAGSVAATGGAGAEGVEHATRNGRGEWGTESGGRGVVCGRSADAWSDYILVPCLDGKTRRLEPGLEPLVDGLPFRLADGRTVEGASRKEILKGLGNAIVPQLAATFLRQLL